jgi:hypothetical protein
MKKIILIITSIVINFSSYMKPINIYDAPISNLVPSNSISICELYQKIKSDAELQQLTQRYRALSDKEEQRKFKLGRLPYITASGTFSKRSDTDIIAYSNFICMDCDGLLEAELNELIEFAKKDVHTVLGFTSPSRGYKLLIRSDSIEQHTATFNSYRTYISNATGIEIKKFDSSCVNVSRACFLAHDDEAYINPLALEDRIIEIPVVRIIEVTALAVTDAQSTSAFIPLVTVANTPTLDYQNKDLEANFKVLIAMKEAKDGQYASPREPWIQSLACYCNCFGMSRVRTLELMVQYFANHPESLNPEKPISVEKYIIAPIKDAYIRYADQHGTWVDTAVKEAVFETPTLPDDIFPILPQFFKDLTGLYDDKRERDIVFLTALTVISSYFPNYSGIYDGKKVWANLFTFIVAPPASGKGKIAAVRDLGNGLQKYFKDIYDTELHKFKEQEREYEEQKKDGIDTHKPKAPALKKVFIPANNTASKIVQTMCRNNNIGVLMDTEADTLTQSLKSEHGNFSDVLRKAFHHEAIELERKKDDEYIMLDKTFLSVVLTGTPAQVNRLINNVENGLLSRILFYTYRNNKGFNRDIFKQRGVLPEDWFSSMSINLAEFAIKFGAYEEDPDNIHGVEFQMDEDEKESFIEWFASLENELQEVYGDDIIPSLRRLALITYRIAMVLSIIRVIDEPNIGKTIECSHNDFYVAISMVDVLLKHTIAIFKQLNQIKKAPGKVKDVIRFLETLPYEFNRKTADATAQQLTINVKTADDYLRKYVSEGSLIRVSQGQYRKVA